jgi:hypothetical protein
MKLVIAMALSLLALGGCAIDAATSATGATSWPRDRAASNCRGVWDEEGKACIGG